MSKDALPLTILSDRPYAWTDGLLRPQLHAIAAASPTADASMFGLVLGGGDTLGLQRWAIAGYVHAQGTPARLSVAGAYHTARFAPWSLSLAASDLRWHVGVDEDPDEPGFEDHEPHRQLDATATLGRVVRGTAYLAAHAVATRDAFGDAATRELAGAGGQLALDTADATPRGGVRRRHALAVGFTHFPARASSVGRLTDLDITGLVAAPVRGTSATGTMRVRGRLLTGANEDLLELGGGGAFAPLYDAVHQGDPLDAPPSLDAALLPDHLRFTEAVRGFEDLSLPASRVAMLEVSLRAPLIIDAGWIAPLWVLPPVLVREVQLEVFATGGTITSRSAEVDGDHRAIGASVTLALALWRAPVLVRWQLARRLTYDDALVSFVGLGVGL